MIYTHVGIIASGISKLNLNKYAKMIENTIIIASINAIPFPNMICFLLNIQL